MTRTLPLLCAVAALLSACGGGAGNNSAPTPPQPKSRLAAFDPEGLEAGLEIPKFTDYWALAEQGNGNAYPVKVKLSDSVVLTARLDAQGALSVREGEEFVARGMAALASSLDTLAQLHWNEEQKASAAALILFADSRAPYGVLLKLCRELVDLRIGNLWLVTRDGRDDALRLLPLLVDTSQMGKDWYELDQPQWKRTLRFTWVRLKAGQETGFDFVDHASADIALRQRVSSENWKQALAGRAKALAQAGQRVQFDLPEHCALADFAEFASLFSPVGYAEVEPFWPALDRPEESESAVEARKLARYADELEVSAGLNLPTLSHWWRASAADRGLAAAGEIDKQRPLLAIKASADGSLATRAQGAPEWTTHADDLEVLQALRQNAGEIDMDTGLSELQVVLAVDRYANWETFLGVLEMMKSVGCFRLYVVTNDLVGPTLRLLVCDLPVGDAPAADDVAAVLVERAGDVAQGKYTVTMMLDGAENKTTGPRFSSSLTQWSGQRKNDPALLGVKLPRDEPFETLFTVLNSVAWLGVGAVSFGG